MRRPALTIAALMVNNLVINDIENFQDTPVTPAEDITSEMRTWLLAGETESCLPPFPAYLSSSPKNESTKYQFISLKS